MSHRHAAVSASLTIGMAALGLALAAPACSPSSADSKDSVGVRISAKDGGAEEAVPVEVAVVSTGEIESILRFSANLEAENQVEVLARSPGLVQNLLVEEGDEVKRGQVLLRLEDEEPRSKLAQLDNDLARARREYEQQKALHGKGVTSNQALDTAKYEVDRLDLMKKDAARALRYTVVRAPIAGTITQRLVQRGKHVNLQQPLFTITDFDSLVARVYVPEKELPRLTPGLPARIEVHGTGHVGAVDRIAPQVDPQSGTVKATISVPRSQELLPGMFVEVALVIDKNVEAVLLPKRALVYDSEVAYAFKLVGADRVTRVVVEPALENRDYVAPASGFAAGDKVVIAGQIGLKDKALVAPSNPDDRKGQGTAGGQPDDTTDAMANADRSDKGKAASN